MCPYMAVVETAVKYNTRLQKIAESIKEPHRTSHINLRNI